MDLLTATRLPSRLVLPAALAAGMAMATVGFARSWTRSSSRRPEEPVAAVRAAPGPPTPAGGAAPRFERRVSELRVRAAAHPDDRGAILELARLLHDGHRPGDAVPLYRRALELDRDEARVWYDLAAAHGALGEWEEAASVLGERLDDDPGDAVALYDLGAVRANQGRMEEARLHLEASGAATTDGALLARISQALARMRGA